MLMFRMLVLQALNNLSDEQVEYQVRDRLSFSRFLGATHWGAGMKLLESRYIGSIASCERPRRGCVLFFGALNLFAVGIVANTLRRSWKR